jgi:hypothetical protein
MSDENVQRALGRIEGTQTQILEMLDKLSESFGEHKNEDQRNFSSVRALFFTNWKSRTRPASGIWASKTKSLTALSRMRTVPRAPAGSSWDYWAPSPHSWGLQFWRSGADGSA